MIFQLFTKQSYIVLGALNVITGLIITRLS